MKILGLLVNRGLRRFRSILRAAGVRHRRVQLHDHHIKRQKSSVEDALPLWKSAILQLKSYSRSKEFKIQSVAHFAGPSFSLSLAQSAMNEVYP